MNIKHSVNAPVLTSKRSTLRRFLAAAATAALLCGVGSASADDRGNGGGTFTITTIAGMGDNYTGKLDVKGDGKFKVRDAGPNLVFTSHIGFGELNMKDGRQKHTVGEDSKLGYKRGARVKLVIEKSKLTFPAAGQEASGTATGKLVVIAKVKDKDKDGKETDKDATVGQEETVNVKYTVKEEGGKYTIKSASFDFDYTKHTPDGKKVCLVLVCVKPTVTINAQGAAIEASK